MPKIENIELQEKHIGMEIAYIPHHKLHRKDYEAPEVGVLSSFRQEGAIFVKFRGPQGERCSPECLFWYPVLTKQDILNSWRNP